LTLAAGVVITGRELVADAVAALAAAGLGRPRVDAEWLLAGMLGLGRAELYRVLTEAVPGRAVAQYRSAIDRRARGEPLQQILGWEGFRGLKLRVTPDVLIPRPETEVLVDVVLSLLRPPRGGVSPLVVDVGTGSGCIASAIARERQDVDVLALDCSAAAIGVARENIETLGVGKRVSVIAADLLSPVRAGRADLIVANPPYLSDAMLASAPSEVRVHEPRLALSGGPDGLTIVRQIVQDAPRALKRGGILVLETAGNDQVQDVADLLRTTGFMDVRVTNDLAGIDRFVSGATAASAEF
jgi:release factor glutamine methyltransferase